MARPLQVWHMAIHNRGTGKQVCAIVAARTQKEAARLLSGPTAPADGVSPAQLRTYGGVTRNDEEVAVAMSEPGTVFVTENMNYPRVYKAANPKHPEGKP